MTSFSSTLSKPVLKWVGTFLVAAMFFLALGYVGARYGGQGLRLTQPGYLPAGKTVPGQGRPGIEAEPGGVSKEEFAASPLGGTSAVSSLPDLTNKVIKSASISVKVKKGEFQRAFSRAMFIAESLGGYVSSSSTTAVDDSANSGLLSIRVPAKDFDRAIAQLKNLGKLQNINLSGTDVSEEYVDIESRLKNLRAQEAILLKLMEKATSIADTIAVETRLSEVQMQIEQFTGRKNFLDNRIAFASIELTLFEPAAQPSPVGGLGDAVKQAAKAFVATIASFIVALGILGPYIILGAVGVLIYLSRRRKAAAA